MPDEGNKGNKGNSIFSKPLTCAYAQGKLPENAVACCCPVALAGRQAVLSAVRDYLHARRRGRRSRHAGPKRIGALLPRVMADLLTETQIDLLADLPIDLAGHDESGAVRGLKRNPRNVVDIKPT